MHAGIFRISGNKDEVEAARKSFEKKKPVDIRELVPSLILSPSYLSLTHIKDIHAVSGLLKLYLRELKTPLMTFELYDAFIAAFNLPSDQQLMGMKANYTHTYTHKNTFSISILLPQDSIDRLPPGNKECVRRLMHLLHTMLSHHEKTKMTSDNLSIVITPSIMWSKARYSLTFTHQIHTPPLISISHHSFCLSHTGRGLCGRAEKYCEFHEIGRAHD